MTVVPACPVNMFLAASGRAGCSHVNFCEMAVKDKVENSDDDDSQAESAAAVLESTLKKIKQLEEEVKASKQNANNIPVLIELCETELYKKKVNVRIVTSSMLALCRIFSRLMTETNFLEPKKDAKKGTESKKVEKTSKDIYVDWMSSNYKRFTKLLIRALEKVDYNMQEMTLCSISPPYFRG
jgi:hypothetical protein